MSKLYCYIGAPKSSELNLSAYCILSSLNIPFGAQLLTMAYKVF